MAPPMAVEKSFSRRSSLAPAWRRLIAAAIVVAVGWGGVVYAANNSVQGAKKDEGGFDGDAPTAILIEASSGSVLFEKNADELRAPSSMMKLMTAEVVFHAIKQGDVKLSDEYRVSENAWRKGGAPAGGSTMLAALNSKISVDDLLHGEVCAALLNDDGLSRIQETLDALRGPQLCRLDRPLNGALLPGRLFARAGHVRLS